eukprot:6214255-Pleurochrysis_carterae.AAC.2
MTRFRRRLERHGAVKFDLIWARTVEISPFKTDNIIAVNFARTVLESSLGARIQHFFAIFTEAAAVQNGQLFLNVRDADKVRVFVPHAGLPAAYILLTSLYHKQRVPVPSKGDLMRVGAKEVEVAVGVAVAIAAEEAKAVELQGLGSERQQGPAAMKESIESVIAGFEVEPYRPWEQLEALKLTKGVLHNGCRILEDAFAEKVLCDVLQAGRQVIHLVANSSAVALPVFSSKVRLSFAPWAGANAQPSWWDWSGSAFNSYLLLQQRLGSALRLSKWRAYSSDPHRGAYRCIDFGCRSMPGGSKLQTFARELSAAYQLRSLRDPEGTDFFDSLVVSWLHEAWRRVQMADAQVAQMMLHETSTEVQLAGTDFTEVT